MLFLLRLLQLVPQFYFGLAFAKLCSDLGGEFQRLEWSGDDVICAKVQSPRTLKRAALHDHQHTNRFRLLPRLDLRDDSAAAQVRWCGFRNEQFRSERFNLLDIQSCLDGNFVSLAGQRFIDFVGRTRTEIQNENSHHSGIITHFEYSCFGRLAEKESYLFSEFCLVWTIWLSDFSCGDVLPGRCRQKFAGADYYTGRFSVSRSAKN